MVSERMMQPFSSRTARVAAAAVCMLVYLHICVLESM